MSKLKYKEERKPDRLGPIDYELFRLGKQNVNVLTDYYMRSPTSGTYWKRRPDEPDQDLVEGWAKLHALWQQSGEPEDVLIINGVTYMIQWDDFGDPIFWQRHGWLWQPWQSEMYHAIQKDITVIGGFGCGKTAAIAATLCVLAMTTPNFRGAAVAPQMKQVKEVYNYIISNFSDTPFFNRFIWNYRQSPTPYIELRNDFIGTSQIEFYSVEQDNGEAMRTLEFDIIVLDQAEKFDDLTQLTVNLGSRLRGQIKGRIKLGKMIYVANSGDNTEIWMRYDQAKTDPDHYKSMNPKSWDNPYLTKEQIERMKRTVAPSGDITLINQYMGGDRPLGRGEHFGARLVEAALRPDLDNIMNAQIAKQIGPGEYNPSMVEDTGTAFPWIRRRTRAAGIYHWEAPPDHRNNRQYIVVADPGQSNPPDRNSAIIMVWDITEFPHGPAVMRAFHWVHCDGEYGPFLMEYERLVRLFKCQSRNAFDSTGTQKGFDELYFAVNKLAATGLNMAGNGKYHAINAAKFFLSKGLMQFPTLPHLMSQLTNYKLPDTKIRQDLVMCFCMSALFMQRYFFIDIGDDEEEGVDRPTRPAGRHDRSGGDRYKRPVGTRKR
jgi:hypothetical protein